jgi:hypothetical protein
MPIVCLTVIVGGERSVVISISHRGDASAVGKAASIELWISGAPGNPRSDHAGGRF